MIIIPSTIQGPAYIIHGGVVQYTTGDVQVEEQVESWTPKTPFGDAGMRHKSRAFKISYTPVGMLTSALLNYFYEAYLAPQTYVGASIFPVSNYALTIVSLQENKTYVYSRAGLAQPPDLYCGTGKTQFGQASLMAIGAAATAPTSATFFKGASGTPSADTSFDQSKIKADIYSLVLGTLASPYNSIGSLLGFAFKFGYKTKNILSGDVGIADSILDSDGFNLAFSFAPSNLTEAQVDTLLNYQGANALLPGQAYGSATNSGDAVLTGNTYGWVFTAKSVGARAVKRVYKIGEHRFPDGALEMVNSMGVTAGVPNPLFTFTAGT